MPRPGADPGFSLGGGGAQRVMCQNAHYDAFAGADPGFSNRGGAKDCMHAGHNSDKFSITNHKNMSNSCPHKYQT